MSEEEDEAMWYFGEVLVDLNDIKQWKIVENLINKLQKEKEELQFFTESYRKQIELMQNEYKSGNFIHKGFIKDKIEELEEGETIYDVYDNDQKYAVGKHIYTHTIKVLQDLLKEE